MEFSWSFLRKGYAWVVDGVPHSCTLSHTPNTLVHTSVYSLLFLATLLADISLQGMEQGYVYSILPYQLSEVYRNNTKEKKKNAEDKHRIYTRVRTVPQVVACFESFEDSGWRTTYQCFRRISLSLLLSSENVHYTYFSSFIIVSFMPIVGCFVNCFIAYQTFYVI